MERLRINGGSRLAGTARIGGAKNSALKLMAASLLAEGRTVLSEVPDILDVEFMGQLLDRLGCPCERAGADGELTIDVPAQVGHDADYDLVRRLRASIVVLGPLLARCGQARVALPGGDRIGSRGLDMHIGGLARLGADVRLEHGYVVAEAPEGLRGAALALDFPSVGATENLLMAAVLARGATVIDNAAREPEIVDLIDMLSRMGAKIGGAGSSTLEIEGQDGLSPVHHATLPDRIVAGTWAVGAVLTRGDVSLERARAEHLEALLDKLAAAGASVSVDEHDRLRVRMDRRPSAVDVITLPYPGFPTDLQPMMVTLAAVSEGTSMVTENLYDGRFGFVQDLARLGADIRTDGHHAIVRGCSGLSGAPVVASDIRAGAALVLAGMVAEGETRVSGLAHIDRGYPALTRTLTDLGVDVVREADDLEPE